LQGRDWREAAATVTGWRHNGGFIGSKRRTRTFVVRGSNGKVRPRTAVALAAYATAADRNAREQTADEGRDAQPMRRYAEREDKDEAQGDRRDEVAVGLGQNSLLGIRPDTTALAFDHELNAAMLAGASPG
jgi:hypothetical protein